MTARTYLLASFPFLFLRIAGAFQMPTTVRAPRVFSFDPSRKVSISHRVNYLRSPLLKTASAADIPQEFQKDKISSSSSVASATFGLMKVILGSGALALPAGLAAASDFPNMLWPANLLIAGLGILSAYTFLLYGRLAYQTGGSSPAEIWKRVQGTDDSFLLSIFNFLYCFGCCLTFSLVIGDSFSSLLQAAGFTGWLASRQTSILAITATTLLPLCNLSSLAALAPMSVIGVLGTLVATAFVTWRCPSVSPNSPYSVTGGRFLKSIPAPPLFRTYNRFKSPAPLVLAAMACIAWMAHFSAPEFYHSLLGEGRKDASTEQERATALRKFRMTTVIGYAAVGVVNALILSYGFLTFGGNAAGIILNNYATQDLGASLSRFLVTVSVIGGYPFLFGAFRSAALDLFAKKQELTDALRLKATSLLLFIVTTISLFVQDAGFVVSFNGALMGASIIYIFPCMMFLKQTAQAKLTKVLRLERWFCRFLMGFGVVSAVLGAVTSVLNSYFPHLLS